MSDTQERPAESTALVAVRTAMPTIIAADNDDILGKLAKELSGFKPDISTEAGRKEIASKARKAATAKMDLIRLAGTLKADHQKVLKGIVAEEKIITERMDGLRDSIRAPLTEFEAREEARVGAHETALQQLLDWPTVAPDATAADIAARLDQLDNSELLRRDWAEFRDRAVAATKMAVEQLRRLHVVAVAREDEARELATLRAEAAERERVEAERLRVEREAEIARQAGETARIAAEAEAQRKAEEARLVAQRADYHRRMLQHVKNCGFGFIDEQPQPIGILQHELTKKIVFDEENFGEMLAEAIAARDEALKAIQRTIDESNRRRAQEEAAQREREAAAERERIAAEALAESQKQAKLLAEKQETDRIAGHQAALADIRLIGQPPDGMTSGETHSYILRMGGLHVYRDWQEFESEAAEAREASHAALVLAHNAAVNRDAEAVRLAEEATQRRETAAAEAAREAERRRVAQEQAAAEAAARQREESVAHRARLNRETALDLQQRIQLPDGHSLPKELAMAIVVAVAKGHIRHVSIRY